MEVISVENYVTEESRLLPVMEGLCQHKRNNNTIVYNTCVNAYYTFQVFMVECIVL